MSYARIVLRCSKILHQAILAECCARVEEMLHNKSQPAVNVLRRFRANVLRFPRRAKRCFLLLRVSSDQFVYSSCFRYRFVRYLSLPCCKPNTRNIRRFRTGCNHGGTGKLKRLSLQQCTQVGAFSREYAGGAFCWYLVQEHRWKIILSIFKWSYRLQRCKR